VNSGNRTVTLAALTLLGLVIAADAGRVGEDGTGAMWIAPELVAAVDPAIEGRCTSDVVVQVADLASAGTMTFEWHPETGELSFDPQRVMQRVTLPEDWLPEESAMLVQPTQSCG